MTTGKIESRCENYEGRTASGSCVVMQALRLLAAWLFVIVYSTPVILFSIFTLRRFTDRIMRPAARMWSAAILKILGIRIEVEGIEFLEGRRARIVIFNHESVLDILWLAYILPPAATAIVKKEFKYVPVINLALWSAGFIFIDRQNRHKALGALDGLPEKMKRERRSLLIAPEGTRTRDGRMLPFKKGAFRLSMSGELEIYPVVVAGAYALLPKTRIFPRRGTLKVTCLPPIAPSTWNKEDLEPEIERVRLLMLNTRSEMEKQL